METALTCPGMLACVIALGSATVAAAANPPLVFDLPPGPPVPVTVEARVFTEDGLEASLARDLARAAGQKLATGAGGVRIGRQDDAQPVGYASGLTVAMRSDTDIRDWSDLAGRTVCHTATNIAARQLVLDHGGVPVPEQAPAISLMKMRIGDCDAALHEAALLQQLFQNPDWAKFSATLPPQRDSAMGLSVADPAQAAQLRPLLAQATTDAAWQARKARWARNVAFEVWLEQEAPDCH